MTNPEPQQPKDNPEFTDIGEPNPKLIVKVLRGLAARKVAREQVGESSEK
jgi:hypothetical protein